MAYFFSNLWEAIFTAGPTPTLMLATNVTFGALQLLLLGLLVATYSIHFAILSFLCGGLWYSINWFARELRQAQVAEAEAERLRKKKRAESKIIFEDADDEGEETEVEGGGLKESTESLSHQDTREESGQDGTRERLAEAMRAKAQASSQQKGTSSGLQAMRGPSSARHRGPDEGMSSASEIGTDSEWEKVEQ